MTSKRQKNKNDRIKNANNYTLDFIIKNMSCDEALKI